MTTDGEYKRGVGERLATQRRVFAEFGRLCGSTAWGMEGDKNRGARLGDGDVEIGMGTSADWHTEVRLVARNSLLDLAIVYIYLLVYR